MTKPKPVLHLFGQPELRLGDKLLALPTRKLMALLAFLTLEGATSRVRLAELLWDATDERARANLRGELYRLKKIGLTNVLEERGDVLVLSGISSDISVFEQAVARGEWQQALEVRRGALLENFVLPGALEFETWLSLARERLEERFNEVLAARAETLVRDGAVHQALELHGWLLRRDPLREDSHRAVMRLLIERQEFERALVHYQRHADFLKREMGFEPSQALQALKHSIERNQRDSTDLERLVAPISLNSPPLVGREKTWFELEKTIGFTLLVGDAGVGKTRLALEFAQDKSYLLAAHRELASQVGFGGLIEGLRSRFEAGWRPKNLESIWRLEAARLLPELGDGSLEMTATNEARFREGLARTLLNTLEPGGILIVDDLQWADESTLLFLPYLVRRAAERNLRLIGTTRPEGLLAGGGLEKALRELERDRLAKRLLLEPLLEQDVLTLIRALSRSDGGAIFSKRLHTATQGNAFYLLETLRALFERGELTSDAGWHTPFDQDTSDYLELSLPESVLKSVQQRFYRLEELPRRLAELLCLCGRDIAPIILEKAVHGSSLEVVSALETLEQAGLVRANLQGYRLTHDLSRTALDQGLSMARRVTLHARLCEVLSLEASDPSLAAEILRHAEASGNHLAARDWAERGAQSAALRYAHREVAALLTRALNAMQNLAPDGIREIKLRLDLETALYHAADREGQHQQLEILERLIPSEYKDELSFRAGRLAESLGKFTDAVRHYQHSSLQKSKLRLVYALESTGTLEGAEQAALEVYESPEQSENAFQAAILLAELTQERGNSNDSKLWLTRAENLFEHHIERQLHYARVRSRLAYHAGAAEDALKYALEGERLAAQTGSVLDEAICANTRAVTLQSLGQFTQVIPVLEKVRAFAKQIEHPILWSVSSLNLGLLHFQLGDFANALTITHQTSESTLDKNDQKMGNLQLGLIYAYQNDTKNARYHFELVLQNQADAPLWQRASLLYGLALVNALEGHDLAAVQFLHQEFEISREFETNWVMGAALQAICLLRLGDPQAALERSSAALAALPKRGLELPAQQIPWAQAQVLHALGDDAGALLALEQANNVLERNAQAVGEDVRSRYLEAFCFNRDILGALQGNWLEIPRLI